MGVGPGDRYVICSHGDPPLQFPSTEQRSQQQYQTSAVAVQGWDDDAWPPPFGVGRRHCPLDGTRLVGLDRTRMADAATTAATTAQMDRLGGVRGRTRTAVRLKHKHQRQARMCVNIPRIFDVSVHQWERGFQSNMNYPTRASVRSRVIVKSPVKLWVVVPELPLPPRSADTTAA